MTQDPSPARETTEVGEVVVRLTDVTKRFVLRHTRSIKEAIVWLVKGRKGDLSAGSDLCHLFDLPDCIREFGTRGIEALGRNSNDAFPSSDRDC